MFVSLLRRNAKTSRWVRFFTQTSLKDARPPPLKPYATRSARTKQIELSGPNNPQGRRKTFQNAVAETFEEATKTVLSRSFWTEVFWIAVSTGCILHLCFTYVIEWRGCSGPSMLPTISVSGDTVLISLYHRRGRGITAGDLVSYKHPMHPGVRGIKRVIAMPGDFVLRDTPGARGESAMVQVPEGHCWIVGDNLPWSRDSRMFGPLPLALIVGKVVVRFEGGKFSTWHWIKNTLEDAGRSDGLSNG